MLLAAIAGCALTARLGLWQLDRGAQKQALQAQIEQRATLPPLDPVELARGRHDAEAQQQRRLTLRGQWMPEATRWLENRQMGGRPGFFVVTPLRLAPGDAILVQRGWVARNFEDRTALPALATPAGDVEVEGRIAPPPARLLSFGAEERGPIRQNLDLDTEARALGLALRPVTLQQLPTPATAGDGLERDWPAPAVDVAKHHGYAFQWFALCALIACLYVWFQLLRPRLRRLAR